MQGSSPPPGLLVVILVLIVTTIASFALGVGIGILIGASVAHQELEERERLREKHHSRVAEMNREFEAGN